MSLKNVVGQHIAKLRKAKGLTQAEFAELIGRSVDSVSLIERGANWPSFETLERIGNALESDPASLLANFGSTKDDQAITPFAEAVELLRQLNEHDLALAVELLKVLKFAGRHTSSMDD
jgi:transcriptional regulator with XRE-family HTH domain